MTSLYDMTIPMFTRMLQALDGVLAKAESWAKEQGVKAEDLTESRLISDMKPLPFQVIMACDTAKFVSVRIGGHENKPQADDQTTFAELRARIAATCEILEKVPRESIDGKHDISVEFRGRTFKGHTYLTTYAIPNFYFHVVTAYDILRHKGVPIGKLDFLGVTERPGQGGGQNV